MNRRRIYILLTLALLLSLSLATCKKGGQPSAPASETPTRDPAAPIPTSIPIIMSSPTPLPTSTPTLIPTPTPILLTPPSTSDYQSPVLASAAPFVTHCGHRRADRGA